MRPVPGPQGRGQALPMASWAALKPYSEEVSRVAVPRLEVPSTTIERPPRIACTRRRSSAADFPQAALPPELSSKRCLHSCHWASL